MEYSEKVQDYFLHPRNIGEIEDADGRGRAGNPRCGDVMLITFKLGEDKKIADIRFKTFGCAAAVATASMVTELAQGKTLEEAEKIEFQQIVDALGGLPPLKMHCSSLAITTLRLAIQNARGESDGDMVSESETEPCIADCPKACAGCEKEK